MARRVILTPEANSDTQEVFDWYEERQAGLGWEFLESLEEAYQRIATHPSHYPIRFDNFRRILIGRFPFAVYFDHDDSKVIVYYVFHSARDPSRLARRLRRKL